LKSGKIYVGSSVNLGRRFRDYYNYTFLEGEIKKNNSIIYKALVKYGYSSFKLEILENCEPNILIEREQYYLDLLNPSFPTPHPTHVWGGVGGGGVKIPRGPWRRPIR